MYLPHNLSSLEQVFWVHWCAYTEDYPDLLPAPHYPLGDGTRRHLDFAWPAAHVALEVQGGVFTGGKHVRPLGHAKDIQKYNTALLLGWRLLLANTYTLTSASLRQDLFQKLFTLLKGGV